MTAPGKSLTPEEKAVYEWQMWIPEFGEKGQTALKGASVLISRCGGVGGAAAYYLAAAGIGRVVLAHAGDIRMNDLNRQILMTQEKVGTSRVESAARRLKELNPRLEVDIVPENISETNVAQLVGKVDLVVDAAPLFSERYLMNGEAVRQQKPLIECAMYGFEAQLTTIIPGRTACLACLYPNDPPAWKREFPVLGAVTGTVGSLGATEAIKVLTGIGQPLLGKLLVMNLKEMTFRCVRIERNPTCAVCGKAP
jgi:molybdopterin/thiamine biosynthesis adenylyltransferase